MPRHVAAFLSALALVPGLALGATNLIANPRFDVGIAGWSPGLGAASVSWSPLDESAKPASGSLRMTGLEVNKVNDAWSSCFSVSPGATMVFGISAFSPAASVYTAFAKVRFYDGPNCSGSSISELVPDPETHYALGASTWGPIQGNGLVPAAAQSGALTVASFTAANPPAELFFDNAFVYQGESCATTSTVACLNDRRFRVAMTWRIPDGTRGYGTLVPFTSDSVRASFFAPANVEAVLKVLDGCAVNQRYWVFAAGLTNVEVGIRVTDTQTGESWEYENALDQAFPPVQDTSAFADCPH